MYGNGAGNGEDVSSNGDKPQHLMYGNLSILSYKS